MTSSLVGSEMCIRDSCCPELKPHTHGCTPARLRRCRRMISIIPPLNSRPVSYTHLTLPTICSV
eukprot:1754548-Prorocentrum_lima.AAC.1